MNQVILRLRSTPRDRLNILEQAGYPTWNLKHLLSEEYSFRSEACAIKAAAKITMPEYDAQP